jgi:dipeptidyl aminopeptidase/acylaminoacyl peptidase
MSLVGSSGGSGTAHFDFGEKESLKFADLHLCNMGNTTSYERFDLVTGQHKETLASHEKSDITGFLLHPKTKQVQAVRYNYEKPSMCCLKDCPQDIRDDLDYLQQQFPGASYSIASRTLNDQIWVVYVQSDTGIDLCSGSPSDYLLFYRTLLLSTSNTNKATASTANRVLELVGSPQPELAKYSSSLGNMKAVHIPARDGEDLLCYLSTPSNVFAHTTTTTTTTTHPLVLLIHGGPQARDVWQFHPWCQLLCNRGMSVLQVNYRGSTGMGSRFVKIGMDGVFATRLQEDIQDAAHFAIQQKWCPANTIAIMGGSFGGYCSLAAMTFLTQSDLNPNYQCAVAICPPSIFGAANPHKAFYGNPLIARYWKQVFGPAISNDVKASQAVSPLFHMEKAQTPILVLHGEDDPRVPIEQSNQAVQKLNVGGCEYYRFGKEGHGIQKEQNILYMAHCIERFLCRNLQLPEPPALEEQWIHGHTSTSVSLELIEGRETKDKKI